jgi:hypothetical protein
MGEPVDGGDVVDRVSHDVAAGALREELLGALALRDLLDHDLEHRGVSTPRGGERRQVTHRLQVSRDLVRLADRIRTEARRATRSGDGPLSTWDVARDIASDLSQQPSDVLAAARYLLTHRPPRVRSPELEQWEEELRGMSEAEIDAAIVDELKAAAKQPRPTPRASAEVGDDREDEPERSEAPDTEEITRCLEILQRIGDGFDPRASGRDRMRAAELREQHLAATSRRDAILEEEIELWVMEDLESLLAEFG